MVRFIFYNVEYFEGIDGRFYRYAEIWRRIFGTKKNLIRICDSFLRYSPDILAIAEIQSKSFFGRKKYGSFIKSRLGFKHSLIHSKYSGKGLLGFFRTIPILKDQSNAIFSRFKLRNEESFYLKKGVKKLVLKVVVNVPKKVTFLIVHLALGESVRGEQIEELVSVVNKVEGPVILAGDFNSFNGRSELKPLIQKTKLRKIKESSTYPAFHPKFKLDHILISPEIKIRKYDAIKLELSDHVPILIDFVVK